MSISTAINHDAVKRTATPDSSALRRYLLDNQNFFRKKMSDLNIQAIDQQQDAIRNVYVNFGATQTTNATKQSPQSKLQSRQTNGWAGGDPATSPGSPKALQQNVSMLQEQLEESRRNEAHLQGLLRQQMALFHPNHMNGSSLTPDGLPAAPSSDGILESVKDGHIRRLGREVTLLKAKLHEEENRALEAEKERDLAFKQVASLSSLLAESDQRCTSFQRQVQELKSAIAELHLQQTTGAEREKQIQTLTEMLDKQRAEISTLKESLQRLSRENASLKHNEVSGSSRQSNSLGSGGSSSVACSQELEYLHKVVDTLKATVLEQHGKLRSLRFQRTGINQPALAVTQPMEVQSFPVASAPSASCIAANVGGSLRLAGTGRVSEANMNLDWSIDGSTTHQEAVSKPTTGITAVAASKSPGILSTSNSYLSPVYSTQDDQRTSALDNASQKLSGTGSKYIPGISQGGDTTEGKGVATGAIANPGYYQTPQNFGKNWSSHNSPVFPGNPSAVRANFVFDSGVAATRGKAQSQVITSSRMNNSAPNSDKSGSRLLSKAEVIAVSSGMRQPTAHTTTPAQAATAGLSTVTGQDRMNILGMRPSPPPLPSSRTGAPVSSQALAQQLAITSGMVGVGAASTLMQLSRAAQPQYIFEAEIEPHPGTYPAVGGSNLQQEAGYLPQRLPTTSSSVTPAPSSSSVLSNYQTAAAASISASDRDHMRVVNKHMMGGGNVIFQQDPLYTPQQVPFGTTLPPNHQNMTGDSPALSLNQHQQDQELPFKVSAPGQQAGNQSVYNESSQDQGEDVSEPRCNSDRLCPVCARDFSHVPMEEFQAHFFECFDEAGPETMKASVEERPSSCDNRSPDRTCPVCNARFESSVPQADFERHVHGHFGEENFEILS